MHARRARALGGGGERIGRDRAGVPQDRDVLGAERIAALGAGEYGVRGLPRRHGARA